jgi:hypothetical protein
VSADAVIALIEQHGLEGLCHFDGCPCISFELHRICVDISCRKSMSCVRVYSNSLDYYEPVSGPGGPADLERVMVVVMRELRKYDDYTPFRQSFVSFEEEQIATTSANINTGEGT